MVLIVNCFAITVIAGLAFATPLRINLENILNRGQPYNPNLIRQENRVSVIRADSACTGSIVGNVNLVYNCENSSGDLQNNRNTKVSAVSSTLTVTSNTNAGIHGTNNKIVAVENSNLVVGGDNNRLDISNTRNHEVRPAGSSRNTVTFSKPHNNSHLIFNVEYVQSARIDGSKYQLGNYNFDVEENNGMVRVTLQVGSVRDNTSNTIVIQGQGNQSLELIGQRVEILNPKSFNIYCY